MVKPSARRQPTFQEPVVLLHSPGFLAGIDSNFFDDIFMKANQWANSDLPPQGMFLEVIRGMVDVVQLAGQMPYYRLGVIMPHPATYVQTLYQLARVTVTHPLHVFASNHSLDDFAQSDDVAAITTNPFTRALSGQINGEISLKAAQQRLHRAEYVALAERQIDALIMLMYWLDEGSQWDRILSLPDSPALALSDAAHAAILARNPLDSVLYEDATALYNAHHRSMVIESLTSNHSNKEKIRQLELQIQRLKSELGHQAKTNARRAQLIRDFIRKT
ncbi:MAG: hypothetical protein KC546_14965 [Anaerolineae bacterium]|nr:hypothetical protein [Anaerolineae bacterium]